MTVSYSRPRPVATDAPWPQCSLFDGQRQIVKLPGVDDVAYTRRYHLCLGTYDVQGDSDTLQLSMTMPQGIYQGQTEKQRLEGWVAAHMPEWKLWAVWFANDVDLLNVADDEF